MILAAKKVIMAKIETVYGTAATPSPATDALAVTNFSLTPLEGVELAPAVVKPVLGEDAAIPMTGLGCKIEFDVPLPNATMAGTIPWWGRLMRGCGWSETNTPGTKTIYALVGSGFESLTFEAYRDGVKHQAVGCRGDWSFKVTAAGEAVMHFAFTGLYKPVADGALPSGTVLPNLDIYPADATYTNSFVLHGVSLGLKDLEIKLGNDVQHRHLTNAERIDIVGQKPSGTATVEEPSVATFDAWAKAQSGAAGALEIQHGLGSGKSLVIACPRVQIGKPGFSDDAGVSFLGLPLRVLNSAQTAHDAITVTLQ